MAEATHDDPRKLTAPEGPPSGNSGGGAVASPGGFFSIYKSGQGYWTRLITCIAAALLLLVISHWVYTHSRIWLTEGLTSEARPVDVARSLAQKVALGIAAGIFLITALLAWKIVNSPRGADFLITTDSEMKKVNWATRKEVVGSTRVVILFIFFVGLFLFFSDILFSWFFHVIKVLKASPFG